MERNNYKPLWEPHPALSKGEGSKKLDENDYKITYA
jgi:hypothetical protein